MHYRIYILHEKVIRKPSKTKSRPHAEENVKIKNVNTVYCSLHLNLSVGRVSP